MKRQKIYFFIGIILILIPLLGFSISFKNFTTIFLGFTICIFSYTAIGTRSFFKKGPKHSFRDLNETIQKPLVSDTDSTI